MSADWKPRDVAALDASEHWTGMSQGAAAKRVAAFLREIEAMWGKPTTLLTANNGGTTTLRWLAEAFEEISRDPKPNEPDGLGAVVEAIYDNHFIHAGNGVWMRADDARSTCTYDEIAVVRVLSEGWTA